LSWTKRLQKDYLQKLYKQLHNVVFKLKFKLNWTIEYVKGM